MYKTPPIPLIIIPQIANFVNYGGHFTRLCYDKTMIRKLLLPLFALAVLGTSLISTPVFAEGFRSGTECYLLGMPSWDCNVQEINNESTLKEAFPVIATNILNIITVIASYLVIGYIIYGGYLYMFSNGDTGKVATGKKALNQAFIGLAITLSATVILSSIRIALVGDVPLDPLKPENGTIAANLVKNLIDWVIGVAGAISLIFIVGGGILYVTSSGDSSQLQKAKNTIKYALIGLVIVALSLVISNFMATTINNANDTSENSYLINNQKEYYENQLS